MLCGEAIEAVAPGPGRSHRPRPGQSPMAALTPTSISILQYLAATRLWLASTPTRDDFDIWLCPPPHIHPTHSQHHRMDTSQKRKGYYIRFIQQHIFHASDFTNTYFLCVPCQQHRLMMISCSYAQQASPFTRLSYYQSTDSGKVHRLRPASSPSNRKQIASCCSMELLEMQFPAHWSHHTSC
jgi:hypothetical protein